MAMKWVEAHRKLDAGIPIEDWEWRGIDRSLNIFYGTGIAFVTVFAIFMCIWGSSDHFCTVFPSASQCRAVTK